MSGRLVCSPVTVTSSAMAKWLVERVLPVDQPDGLGVLAHVGLDLHAVAQQAVDLLVDVVEALALVAGGLLELVQGAVDQRLAVPLPQQIGAQVGLFDVAVAGAIFPVAEVVVFRGVSRNSLTTRLWVARSALADGAHVNTSFRRSGDQTRLTRAAPARGAQLLGLPKSHTPEGQLTRCSECLELG